ncbi:MAG: hypothetical protein P4L50_17470 [Anaerolineaceae bacterium]|nr:hypothetical protein [Anaerolineaceae bacterium]
MRAVIWRIYTGIILVGLGLIILLQNLGVFQVGSNFEAILFGTAFILGGFAFLAVLFTDRAKWWAVIPGISLCSIGILILVSSLLPAVGEAIGGGIVLGGVALSFWVIFFLDHRNWWAIIPAGALLTLAAITVLPQSLTAANGFIVPGVLFTGMGLTFALLGVMRIEQGRWSWPWIPAAILIIMGVLFALSGYHLMQAAWPVILILFGLFLVFRAAKKN